VDCLWCEGAGPSWGTPWGLGEADLTWGCRFLAPQLAALCNLLPRADDWGGENHSGICLLAIPLQQL
jgi:hypothetical protein